MSLTATDKKELIELFTSIKQPRVRDCSDDIQAIITVQARQTEQIDNLMTLVDKITSTIYGNGKPGLVTTISGLVSKMNFIQWIGIILGGLMLTYFFTVITH